MTEAEWLACDLLSHLRGPWPAEPRHSRLTAVRPTSAYRSLRARSQPQHTPTVLAVEGSVPLPQHPRPGTANALATGPPSARSPRRLEGNGWSHSLDFRRTGMQAQYWRWLLLGVTLAAGSGRQAFAQQAQAWV